MKPTGYVFPELLKPFMFSLQHNDSQDHRDANKCTLFEDGRPWLSHCHFQAPPRSPPSGLNSARPHCTPDYLVSLGNFLDALKELKLDLSNDSMTPVGTPWCVVKNDIASGKRMHLCLVETLQRAVNSEETRNNSIIITQLSIDELTPFRGSIRPSWILCTIV